jgi:hypothetical protein
MSKNWSELSETDKEELFKRLKCSVRVKLNNEQVFEFNPFRVCASMPAKYTIKWILPIPNAKPQIQYIQEHEMFKLVELQCVETNNLQYLTEAKFKTTNIIENQNL